MKKLDGDINIKSVIIIIIIILIIGFVIYELYLKNTKYYTVIDGQITKSQIKNSLTKNEASKKAEEIISKLSEEDVNIEEFEINRYIKDGELYWNLKNDDYELKINAISGNLISYTDNNIIQEDEASEEEANNALNEIIEEYEIPEEYEIKKLKSEYNSKWYAELSKKHHDVFNEYEQIEIYFIPKTNKIVDVEIKNYIYTDNEEKITEEEAKQIAKDIYQEDDVAQITAQKSIAQVEDRTIDSGVYAGDEYEIEKISEAIEYMNKYKENRQIRNVWEVTIKNTEGNVAIYGVDLTSGNVIRKAFVKESNLEE